MKTHTMDRDMREAREAAAPAVARVLRNVGIVLSLYPAASVLAVGARTLQISTNEADAREIGALLEADSADVTLTYSLASERYTLIARF